MMLELRNMRMKSSNMRGKKRKKKPPNVTKEQSHVRLELHNMMIEPSNMRKNKGTSNVTKV